MRSIIIDRINDLKLSEEDFKSKWWKNNFVSFTHDNTSVTRHISEVDFNKLVDCDLVRIFEYIILCKSDISTMRIKETYFNI